MMLAWTGIEALIFTFVMHPLVVDVMDSFAEGEFAGGWWLKVLLFTVFSFLVLGSYAVIHTFGEALRTRRIGAALAYGLIEVIVATVETVLFYREFIDALVPWFAQYAGDKFELGIFGTLGSALAMWFGIRCMTWFLFGAAAIPILLAMIQRSGIDIRDGGRSQGSKSSDKKTFIEAALDDFRADMNWVHSKGDHILSTFVVPPTQLVAACINFCTLFVSGTHLFSLPFKSSKDIVESREFFEKARKSLRKD
jgi:hypothetical protein